MDSTWSIIKDLILIIINILALCTTIFFGRQVRKMSEISHLISIASLPKEVQVIVKEEIYQRKGTFLNDKKPDTSEGLELVTEKVDNLV